MPSSNHRQSVRTATAVALLVALSACGSTVQTSARNAGSELGGVSAPQSTASLSGAPGTGTTATTTADPQTGTAGLGQSGVTAPGTTTSAPTASAVESAVSTARGTLPDSGRGWDKNVVHIGVTTAKDIGAVGQSLGVNSVNAGDIERDALTMAAYLNSQGGIFGRRVKVDFYDVKTTDNAETVGQAICTYFTQDRPVIALINMTTNGDTANFDACVAKKQLPTLAWIVDTGDDAFFKQFNGYYNNLPFPSWSRFARPFVHRLVAQKYFSPWNNTAGAPGSAPVKVGLLEPDTPQGRSIGKLLIRELKAAGHAPDPANVIYFRAEQDLSSAQIKFRSNGVTHVIGAEVLFLFMQTFESQQYRPRYGINTSNAPSLFLEGTSPAKQLTGAVGVGTTPTIDVFASQDPGPKAVAGMALCDGIYKRAGVIYAPDERYAHTNKYGLCDGFRLIVEAAKTTGGLTGALLRDGLGQVGPRVPSSLTFTNGLSPEHRGMAGSGRDLFYDSGCSCFRYRGATYLLDSV